MMDVAPIRERIWQAWQVIRRNSRTGGKHKIVIVEQFAFLTPIATCDEQLAFYQIKLLDFPNLGA